MAPDLDRQTVLTKIRYDRIASTYDAMQALIERSVFLSLRQRLWADVPAGRILEVGVGTGKNMPHYPSGAQVTAIDLSDKMLERARARATSLGITIDLRLMDAQRLEFLDHTFDAAVASFVFCSVPEPIQGLRELGRVVRPDGDIWLLEHVRIDRPIVGSLMDVANPLAVRIMGANINRRTVENVKLAGLRLLSVENFSGDLVKLIHARPPA